MKTIHKYPLKITDVQPILIAPGYRVAHVGLDPIRQLCLWAIIETETQKKPGLIFVVGTGHPIPDLAKTHLGSYVDAPFVWHIFASLILP